MTRFRQLLWRRLRQALIFLVLGLCGTSVLAFRGMDPSERLEMSSDQLDAIKCGALAEVAALLYASGAVGKACTVAGNVSGRVTKLQLLLLQKLGVKATAEQIAGAQILFSKTMRWTCPMTAAAILSRVATLDLIPDDPITKALREGANACLNVGGILLGTVYDCATCLTDPIDDANPGDTPGVKHGRLCRASSGTWNPFGSLRENCRGCCYDKAIAGTIRRDQVPGCLAACHEE